MPKKIVKMLRNEKGLSLVEVLISIAILSLIAMTFLNVFLTSFNNSIKAQEITNYTYATQGLVEELRSYDYGTLLKEYRDHPGKENFDINGDDEPDCFVQFSVQPYGVMDKAADGRPGAFVHLMYLVDKVLVVYGDGKMIHTSAKTNPSISLYVNPNSDACRLTVNGNSMQFSRIDKDKRVCVIANLNYKDLGYNNKLVVTGDRGDVIAKSYGNDVIIDEFEADVSLQQFTGIQNANSCLVKIDIELFHDINDSVSFFSISEICEIIIGDRDSLVP